MAFNLTAGDWRTAKYRYLYTGESGTSRIAEIHEDLYDNRTMGVEDPAKITSIVGAGRGSVATRYELDGADDEYAPFRPSTTTLSFFDSNETLVGDLLDQLNSVGDKYAVVLRQGDTLEWVGLVDPQSIEINEQGPVAIKIEASCGLKKRLDESPYLDDPSSTFQANEGPITLTSAIAKMIGVMGYGLDIYIATKIKPLGANFTAEDGDEKCPLRFIWTNELAFTSGKDDEYGTISSKAALKIILEAFGLTMFQSAGAWHIIQVNIRHSASDYRRWAFDSDGIDKAISGPDNFESFDHTVSLTNEELERTISNARFVPAYSSVITQYQHGKVRYIRRPGFQVGTIREAENLFAGNNPWTESGTASIQAFVNDDLACRIDLIEANNFEDTTGYSEVSESTSEVDVVYINGDDTTSSFTTIVNGNTVSQTTASVYAGTTLRFFAAAHCDAAARRFTRPDYILFQLKHNGDSTYAYWKTDGSLGWQAGANWLIVKNMAAKDDWTTFAHDFSDATTADGTLDITMGPIFEDPLRNLGEPKGYDYIWWDNVNLKPILADGEKDAEATSVVHFVNGARSNPRPRNVVMKIGDGPSAANRGCLFTDITLETVTGNWEQTTAAHGGSSTGESLSRIVGTAMLKSMNQFRRVREGGYPGRNAVLTPLDTIQVSSDLYVPLELDINWATEVTGGKWYLANEQAFISDLVEGISTGFSGFSNYGRGQSTTNSAFYNRIGSSFDTLIARESDRLGTVATANSSTDTVVVAAGGLSFPLEVGDTVFFQSTATGRIIRRVVDTYTDVNNFTVTEVFSASEAIDIGDPILPGTITGMRIDMDGVSIINTHIKNDGTNAWDGVVNPKSGAITTPGTQGWIITRTGEAEFNDVLVRGELSTGSITGNLLLNGGSITATDGTYTMTIDESYININYPTIFDVTLGSGGLNVQKLLPTIEAASASYGAGVASLSGVTLLTYLNIAGTSGATSNARMYADSFVASQNYAITTSSGYLSLAPTGDLYLKGLIWPSADGTADQVLKTDGSGNLGWATVSGGSGTLTGITASGNGITVDNTDPAVPNITLTFQGLSSAGTLNGTDDIIVLDGSKEEPEKRQIDTINLSLFNNDIDLTDLADVSGTPADKHILYYDAGGPGWVSETLASALGDQSVSSLINDAGYTSNAGTVTSVISGLGSGIGVTSATTTPTLVLDLSELGTGAIASFAGVSAGGDTVIQAIGSIPLSSFNDDLSYGTGTVTSVSGTGSVSGLTLSGTVTSSGNLTLGGTLAVADGSLSSNVVLKNSTQTITGAKTFTGIPGADMLLMKYSTAATVGSPLKDSPRMVFTGSAYSGGASDYSVDNYLDMRAADGKTDMVWEQSGVTFKMDFDTPQFLVNGTALTSNTGDIDTAGNGLTKAGTTLTIDASVASGTGGYGGDTDTLTLVTADGTTVLILCEAV